MRLKEPSRHCECGQGYATQCVNCHGLPWGEFPIKTGKSRCTVDEAAQAALKALEEYFKKREEIMSFKKAERKQVKIKLAINGPSGSGKTYSALRLAKGMGGKIAVIDTEQGSASLYSDRFEFDTLTLGPPFTTDKYLDAINDAVKAGYDILVIDSISHQWAGQGGMLERKAQMDSTGKSNSFANWNRMTPEHERFKSAIQHSNIHIISTIRSKTEYALVQDDKGKQSPRRMGMAPIQRDGIEYEFTIVFDLSIDHHAEVSKDRTSLFVGQVFQVTEKTGELIKEWASSGTAEVIRPTTTPEEVLALSVKRSEKVKELIELNPSWLGKVSQHVSQKYLTTKFSELTEDQFNELCQMIANPRPDQLAEIEPEGE